MEPAGKNEAQNKRLRHRGRMRRRIQDEPLISLNAYKLMEVLLFEVVPRRDTVAAARALYDRYEGFGGIVVHSTPQKRPCPAGETQQDVLDLYMQTLGAVCRRALCEKGRSEARFESLSAVQRWFFTELPPAPRGTVFVSAFSSDLKRRLMKAYRLPPMSALPALARQIANDITAHRGVFILMAFTHRTGFLAPSPEEYWLVRTLLDVCLRQSLYFIEAAVIANGSIRLLSNSYLFEPAAFKTRPETKIMLLREFGAGHALPPEKE